MKNTIETSAHPMNIQLTIDSELAHGRTEQELQGILQRGLALQDYLNNQLSIGRFSELMGMPLVEMRDWLHHMGIATARPLPPNLTTNLDNNTNTLIAEYRQEHLAKPT